MYRKAYGKMKKLPKLVFEIEGKDYVMGAEDYMCEGRRKLTAKSSPAIISNHLHDRKYGDNPQIA